MFVTEWLNWDGALYFISLFNNDCWGLAVFVVIFELLLCGFAIMIRIITLIQSFSWKKAANYENKDQIEMKNDKKEKFIEKEEAQKVASPEEEKVIDNVKEDEES